MDWFAAGLPRGGRYAEVTRVGDVVREAPSCAPGDRVGDVLTRHGARGSVLVTSDGTLEGVVHGVLRSQLEEHPDALAGDVMHLGPITYRANVLFEGPVHYMRKHHLDNVIITTPEGVALGLLYLEDALPHVHEDDGDGEHEEAAGA